MNVRLMLVALGVLMTAAGTSVRADVTVDGSSVNGMPGTRVFLELIYHYGNPPGVKITLEALDFDYPSKVFAGSVLSDALTFLPEASSIDLFGPQSLPEYIQTLADFADTHGGNVTTRHAEVTPAVVPSRGRYVQIFSMDSVGQSRVGNVSLKLAFNVHQTAPPGFYPIVFPDDRNLLIDESLNEFAFASPIQNIGVNVLAVPEPKIALMLLPGLALIVLYARVRGARRERQMDGRIDC